MAAEMAGDISKDTPSSRDRLGYPAVTLSFLVFPSRDLLLHQMLPFVVE
jgi:hypothetical protein